MTSWRDHLSETNRCLYCHEVFSGEVNWTWALGLSEEKLLCPACEGKLEEIKETGCDMCGRPVEQEGHEFVDSTVKRSASFVSKPQFLCRDCSRWGEEDRWKNHSLKHRALYSYNDFLQEVMATFKYRGDAEIATLFSGKLKKLAKSAGRIDVVTVIPLADDRLWERGFNQAELLAGAFRVRHLLVRTVSTEKQSKRDRRGRMAALEGAFRMSEEGERLELSGKRVLIVDDIYTTGSTLRSAASVMYEAGAVEVLAVTVARATGKLKK
ncbi:hypothetical protein CR194_14095 [Salipaludibacillus keqinensis]|uniref:Phosphoribosyltransferase domain-containing protein n=1 Tax=Salipaludibacillus keqinensis TaxID=2045207 RepID=A0A323TDF2_9BACI|nr:ComF family protein [Salipaludibacillus keqinensis]PYZ92780.1 hypothetical protein CR194_14095 [Salipaludibacillus keqinensis]